MKESATMQQILQNGLSLRLQENIEKRLSNDLLRRGREKYS